MMGEPLSQSEFVFYIAPEYRVTSLSVVDDLGTQLADAAAWNKNTQYTVKAEVVNTFEEEKHLYAVVAGFDGERMTAVGYVELKGISKSGTYTAKLDNLDMAGATELKLFALDSMGDIKPLMDSATLIESSF